jgi:hypothetical protein
MTHDGSVHERFIRLSDVTEISSAASLSRHVFKIINYFLCVEKLVAPAMAYELLLKLYGEYFNSLHLKTQISIVYSLEVFLKSRTSDMLKYLTASNCIMALPEVTELVAMLLNIPTTSVCHAVTVRFEEHLHLPTQHADSG